KILQRAVVEVLNAIYETDFLGFSYGFRPGRQAHMALDILATAIRFKKISWILDADVSRYLDASSHYTSRCFQGIEEVRSGRRYLYSQAFCSSPVDMNRLDFAALYTLQDRLPRDAEQQHCLVHLHVSFRRIFNKARTQLIVDSDAPRRAGRHLLSCNEAIIEPAMQGGGSEAQCACCLLD
ncbi:RNA-directed DNA polymerase (Reverse transcriptase), partial [mine drainage metagenome]